MRVNRPRWGVGAWVGATLAWIVTAGAGCDGPGGGVLVAEEDPLDLGAGYVNRELSGALVLLNDGDADVDLQSLLLIDDANTRFRFRSGANLPLPRTMAPGETFSVDVVFLALDAGVFYGAAEATWAEAGEGDESTLEVIISAAAVDTEEDDADGDGYTEADGDCDDHHPEIYPGADERCDGLDNDCDGVVPADEADDDGDGWRICAGDCDDADATRYPGAEEQCNGIDDDCNGSPAVAEDDEDGDGVMACDGDCNDQVAEMHPGATEVCDGLDNDCDGVVDQEGADGCDTWWADLDGDTYGDPGDSACLCAEEGDHDADNDGDCYDGNDAAHPQATGWHASDRGDGSFDYDCDGAEERRWTDEVGCTVTVACDPEEPTDCTVTCTLDQEGWSTSPPACGSSGFWVTGCVEDQNALSCTYAGTTETQECR